MRLTASVSSTGAEGSGQEACDLERGIQECDQEGELCAIVDIVHPGAPDVLSRASQAKIYTEKLEEFQVRMEEAGYCGVSTLPDAVLAFVERSQCLARREKGGRSRVRRAQAGQQETQDQRVVCVEEEQKEAE